MRTAFTLNEVVSASFVDKKMTYPELLFAFFEISSNGVMA